MTDTTSPVMLDQECFFIAPIGDEGSEERKRSDGVLNFIVQDAVKDLGLTAVRADQIGAPGQITLQVLDHVLGAKAAVADLTGLNPNVFYELAVRHTAKLPVVLIAAKGQRLPFDISQMRTIFFDHTDLADAARCRAEIVVQLAEALNGSVDSPIATALGVRELQSGGSVEQVLGQLVGRVEQVAIALDDLQDKFDEYGSAIKTVDLGIDRQRPGVMSVRPRFGSTITSAGPGLYILSDQEGSRYLQDTGLPVKDLQQQFKLLPEVEDIIRMDAEGTPFSPTTEPED